MVRLIGQMHANGIASVRGAGPTHSIRRKQLAGRGGSLASAGERREARVLFPYGRLPVPRGPYVIDRWAGAGWQLLERHELRVRAPAAVAVEAVASTTLAELPAVRVLFALRGLGFSKEMTLRGFFSTRPFVWLEEEVGREAVFGVLIPPAGPGGRKRPTSPAEFREALGAAPFAALGTFRAEPEGDGVRLWTETWSRTRGAMPSLAFGAYWLVIGPWSAWIRRMFLRAARARAERGQEDRGRERAP
jgi:hypothetical protein